MGQHFVRLILEAVLLTACAPPRGLPPDTIPPVAAADAPLEQPPQSCVRSWPEARFRSYAYDHIVHLQSDCHREASCSVSTNVSPSVIVVAIPPGEHVEVVTLRGSETPDFTPLVECSRGTR